MIDGDDIPHSAFTARGDALRRQSVVLENLLVGAGKERLVRQAENAHLHRARLADDLRDRAAEAAVYAVFLDGDHFAGLCRSKHSFDGQEV